MLVATPAIVILSVCAVLPVTAAFHRSRSRFLRRLSEDQRPCVKAQLPL
jgi:hypothetical protein